MYRSLHGMILGPSGPYNAVQSVMTHSTKMKNTHAYRNETSFGWFTVSLVFLRALLWLTFKGASPPPARSASRSIFSLCSSFRLYASGSFIPFPSASRCRFSAASAA